MKTLRTHLALLMTLFTLFRLSSDDGGGDGGSGGEGGDGGNAGGSEGGGSDGGQGGGESGGGEGKSFSQDDLTRIATAENRKGKNQAMKDVLAELGVDSLDDAKATLDAIRKAEDDRKDEATKLTEAATKREAEAEARIREANARAFRADLVVSLMSGDGEEVQPLRPDRQEQALNLAAMFASTYDGDEADLVAETTKHLRETVPEFFGASGSGDSGNNSNNGTPGTPGRPGGQHNSGNVSASDSAKSMYERHMAKKPTGGLFPTDSKD